MTSSVAPISDENETGIPNTVVERQHSDSLDKAERVPKRILHFSDGTLEEFSSDDDEDDIEPKMKKKTCREVGLINPAVLTWMPWMFYQTTVVGSKVIGVCEFFGEYLANFFGITTPKYEYEIEHYKKMIEEEKERKKQDVELGAWSEQSKTDVVTEQLKNTERHYAITYVYGQLKRKLENEHSNNESRRSSK